MSKIKVNSLEGVGASTPAISIDNASGTCTANLTSIGGSHLSNRNKIINGGMTVSQRYGTTAQTGLSGNVSAYYIDRFKLELDNLGTWSLSQSTESPDGFANSLKLDCTTADASPSSSDLLMISHRMEGQNLQDLQKGTSGAKKVVVSFYVKSTKTGTFVVELVDKDNSSRHINKTYTVSNTNWNRYTIEFAGDTTGALTNDNNRSLDLNFWLGGGSNYTSGTLQTSWGADTNANRYVGGTNLADSTSNEFYITGVQFEVSDMGVATDFEHRSYGQELALCLRYYQKYSADGNGYRYLCSGSMDNDGDAGQFYFMFHAPFRSAVTSMDTTGTASDYGMRRDSSQVCTSVPGMYSTTSHSCYLVFVKSSVGWSTGQALGCMLISTTAYLGFSAEL